MKRVLFLFLAVVMTFFIIGCEPDWAQNCRKGKDVIDRINKSYALDAWKAEKKYYDATGIYNPDEFDYYVPGSTEPPAPK